MDGTIDLGRFHGDSRGPVSEVSVLTAVLQPDPGFLVEAYDSLRAQAVGWEWVIQLDGGEDDVGLVPDGIVKDERVSVAANGSKLGTATTRNLGLLRCRAELIQVLDGDDAFYPGVLECLVEAIAPAGIGLAFGQSHHFGPSGWIRQWQPAPWPAGRIEPGVIGDTWLATGRHHVTLSASMWKAIYLHAAGGWAAMQGMQDVSMLMAITEEHAAAYVDIPVLRSRVHAAQSTSQPGWTGEWELRHRALVAARLLALRRQRGQPTTDVGTIRSPGGNVLPIPEHFQWI